MVKIKCFSVLLVLILLLLLFISCDSGSKAGAGTNTRAVVKSVAGTNTRTVVKSGSGTNTRTVVESGSDKELGAVTGIDERTEPKPEEETGLITDVEVKDEDELAYLNETVIDPRFQALLDNFGVSGAGKKTISYIQRTLPANVVYDYLNQLGADVTIEKIIKPTVSLLRARGKALRVIEGTTDEGIKTGLQDMFEKYDALSFSYLWEVFNRAIKENDFVEFIARCDSRFRKLKEMVNSPRVKDVYAWLDADDRVTIDDIGKIVISGTYDKDRFNNMLNLLEDPLVIKIVVLCQSIKKRQEEALKAIESVSDDAEKQKLQARFNTLQGEYNSHIRSAFNQSSVDLYFQITGNGDKYRNDFNAIEKAAKAAEAAQGAAAAVKSSGAAGGGS
ncbi:hypothetical protein A7978_04960 (plasmid) [Borrelia turicatae]|uniref:Lipoprotein n=1 Tax=Borrelia turicatae TaxID=142 RepID=A0A172XCT9_BORTU|nr:hypothetical protein [Borrelia turicatae]ANF34461.1 hypothetical protein A7978_04960 [Borrelia turicatae]UPA15541.1 hypothetical protein btBTE5EL_001226 [Borrelia turicatae]